MVLRTHAVRRIDTPIGPKVRYRHFVGGTPVVLHNDGTPEIPTAGDAILVGVLAWARSKDSDRVRLFGVDCTLSLRVRLSGRYYLTATLPCGEIRLLESRTMIAIAEEMNQDCEPFVELEAWEIPF